MAGASLFVGTTLKGRLKQKLAAIGVGGMLVVQGKMNNPTLTPLLATTGPPVVGIYGRRSGTIDSIGLIIKTPVK